MEGLSKNVSRNVDLVHLLKVFRHKFTIEILQIMYLS
jgi:hypothetical protein